jgi:hypothetical protein
VQKKEGPTPPRISDMPRPASVRPPPAEVAVTAKTEGVVPPANGAG